MINFNKNQYDFKKKCKKIALLGTKTGVGVTHIGILLAEFLKEKIGARVAFLEMNYHGHIEKMENELFGYSNTVFSFHGVDYYKELDYTKIEELQNFYEYLIFDFGIQKKTNQKDIEICDEKILIGTLNLWEWQDYMQTIAYLKKIYFKENISYVVNFGNQDLVSRMEKVLKEKVWLLGYQPIERFLSVKIENFFNTVV